jgi:hypothetical protein
MMNLQMARERVRQMVTVWIITVKLVWKSMKIAQGRENCKRITVLTNLMCLNLTCIDTIQPKWENWTDFHNVH